MFLQEVEDVEREAPPAEPASSGVTSQPVDDDSLQDVDDEEFKDAADGTIAIILCARVSS